MAKSMMLVFLLAVTMSSGALPPQNVDTPIREDHFWSCLVHASASNCESLEMQMPRTATLFQAL